MTAAFSAVISGLKSNIVYRFRVASVNDAGQGVFSVPVFKRIVASPGAVVGASYRIVELIFGGQLSLALNVTWQPHSNDDAVLGYLGYSWHLRVAARALRL